MSCLYILDINTLLILFASSIFSYSVACLFIFSMIFFVVKKFLSSIKSHLFIFAFIYFVLGDRLKKNIATVYVKECSFRSFMVLCLIFTIQCQKTQILKRGRRPK